METLKLCLLLLQLSIVIGQFNDYVTQKPTCFQQNMQIREACAEGYESQEKCEASNCCWDETFPTAYRCFKQRHHHLSKPHCDIDYNKRQSCTLKDSRGHYIDAGEERCVENGCCYDSTDFFEKLFKKRYQKMLQNRKSLTKKEIIHLKNEIRNDLNMNPIPSCFAKQEVFDKSCGVPNDKTMPCAPSHGNYSMEECLDAGCCHSQSVSGEIECFKKDEAYADDENKKQKRIEELKRTESKEITADDINYNANLNQKAKFCWSSTYGRGVGRIPGACNELDKQGLLCYPECESGYTGLLFVCWQNCPSGYRDDGAFCFKPAPYGRGVGYPWKFWDGFSSQGMLSRCNKDNPKLGCEMNGAIAYPKCKAGFHNVGCCICSPNCLNGQVDIGISCTKKSYTRKTILPSCEADEEYDAGLCYKKCKKGSNGVGPVCWGSCPPETPVNCGMGCAIDKGTCLNNVFGQVISSIEAIATIGTAIATAGTSLAGTTVTKISAKLAARAALKKVSGSLTKEGVEKALKLAVEEGGKHVSEVMLKEAAYEVIEIAGPENTLEWQDFEPTGIVNAVRYFNHPTCGSD